MAAFGAASIAYETGRFGLASGWHCTLRTQRSGLEPSMMVCGKPYIMARSTAMIQANNSDR